MREILIFVYEYLQIFSNIKLLNGISCAVDLELTWSMWIAPNKGEYSDKQRCVISFSIYLKASAEKSTRN